ncbi:unannotated protein [freshwater metagenome]|uniref:Unannotated protein n=1 Tax=freshwater metagenome TaxID=449393 RepID=A0A6J7H3R0_9ZZZZ|nr:DoxX family membrane protein [Actinomycetota bacterium]
MPAALTLLLGGVFAASGVAKLRDPAGMVVLLRQALRPTVPAFALTRALAVLELALGALLVVAVAPRVAGALAALVLVALSVALRVAARRAPEAVAACGCFGSGAGAPPGQALARNALLIAGAAAVVAWSPGRGPWDLSAEQLAGAVTLAVGLPCAWLLATALAREARRPRPPRPGSTSAGHA